MTKRWMIGLCAAALVAGCTEYVTTQELINARAAYQRARSGPAAQVNPADLQRAAEALRAAEQVSAEEPGSQRAHDLGYIATRRAELADVRAREVLSMQQRDAAAAALAQAQSTSASSDRAELEKARRQLAEQGRLLAQERSARAQAEEQARIAMDRLRQITQLAITEEERGIVITIPGSVLFGFGQSALLPGARDKLDRVAEALQDQPDRTITVEGHTDSVGQPDENLDLSVRRADSVRDYLVSKGIPMDHIRSIGLGERRPVADNATSDGRANNRRVEIVVQPIVTTHETIIRTPRPQPRPMQPDQP